MLHLDQVTIVAKANQVLKNWVLVIVFVGCTGYTALVSGADERMSFGELLVFLVGHIAVAIYACRVYKALRAKYR